jgi:glyoxylase-like metal-dependent hydrolase (beta-lactamase superfamily II)
MPAKLKQSTTLEPPYFYSMEEYKIAEGVWVFTSALYQTTSTVVQTPKTVFVVDPNWLPHEIYRIRDFVDQIKDRRKLCLLFTHSDYDHIVGYGAFHPDVVIATQAFVQNAHKDRDLANVRRFDESHYIVRDYPLLYPDVDVVISHDAQSLELDTTRLTFYLAPGHTAEGMFVLIEPQGIWIAGDYLSDIEFPLIEDSLEAYRNTLGKVDLIMQRHHVEFLIPGHGTVEPSPLGIFQRRDRALEYLIALESHALHGSPFPEEEYRLRYPFWDGINDWHLANIRHLGASVDR